MLRLFLSSTFLIFLNTRLLSQYPDLSKYSIVNAGITVLEQGNTTHTEVPPWMIIPNSNLKQYFCVDGTNSYVAGNSSSNNFITSSQLNVSGPVPVTQSLYDALKSCPLAINVSSAPVLNTTTTGINKGTTSITMNPGFSADAATGSFIAEIVNGLATGQDWREEYYGVYSAQLYTDPVQGQVTLAFQHGENKMVCPGRLLQAFCYSTINPMKAAYITPTSPLTCDGGFYPQYAGFVCASWIPNNASTQYGSNVFNDLGPIAWPSTGYMLPSGQKATQGLRHPSSITYDGYVYVYYLEDGPYTAPGDPFLSGQEGRYGGIKVVRAPLTNALDPHAYQVYYKDPNGNVTWNPALPPGFDKENIDAFWNTPGGMSTDVMGSLYNQFTALETRFSVAQVRNTNYFIGVESYNDYTDLQSNGNPYVKKALRFSSDLLNWGPRFVFETVTSWDQTGLNYPIFMGSDGLSNNLVDANNFYVLGTGSDITSTTNKVHFYLPASASVAGGKILNEISTSAFADSSKTSNMKTFTSSAGIFPNPNHGSFQLGYMLSDNANVQINVFDLTGRLIIEGKPVFKQSGYYQDNVDISSRTHGVYLIELIVNGNKSVYKAIYY